MLMSEPAAILQAYFCLETVQRIQRKAAKIQAADAEVLEKSNVYSLAIWGEIITIHSYLKLSPKIAGIC